MDLDPLLVGLCIIAASFYVYKVFIKTKRPTCHGTCQGCHGAGQCHPATRNSLEKK